MTIFMFFIVTFLVLFEVFTCVLRNEYRWVRKLKGGRWECWEICITHPELTWAKKWFPVKRWSGLVGRGSFTMLEPPSPQCCGRYPLHREDWTGEPKDRPRLPLKPRIAHGHP